MFLQVWNAEVPPLLIPLSLCLSLSPEVPVNVSRPPSGGVLPCGGQGHPVPGQRGASGARGRGAPAVRRAARPASSAGEAGRAWEAVLRNL